MAFSCQGSPKRREIGIFVNMSEAVKDALRAERAMNAALKREKSSSKEKKQLVAPKVIVVAEKI